MLCQPSPASPERYCLALPCHRVRRQSWPKLPSYSRAQLRRPYAGHPAVACESGFCRAGAWLAGAAAAYLAIPCAG